MNKKLPSNVIPFPSDKQTPAEVVQTLTDDVSNIARVVTIQIDKDGGFLVHHSDMSYAELCEMERIYNNYVEGMLGENYHL